MYYTLLLAYPDHVLVCSFTELTELLQVCQQLIEKYAKRVGNEDSHSLSHCSSHLLNPELYRNRGYSFRHVDQ